MHLFFFYFIFIITLNYYKLTQQVTFFTMYKNLPMLIIKTPSFTCITPPRPPQQPGTWEQFKRGKGRKTSGTRKQQHRKNTGLYLLYRRSGQCVCHHIVRPFYVSNIKPVRLKK